MKTVLITGCSSGFGLETAKYFLQQGWKVLATMRNPNPDALPQSENLRILPLDVTSEESIRRLIKDAGPIDALVNNAGIGLLSAFEGTDMKTVRGIFETNVFGVMAMTQAVLPQMRERRSGVIVNVTSSVTIRSLPLLSVYTGSKAAVNAFTGSLAIELSEFNVRAHMVLPGRAPETKFADNAGKLMREIPAPYMPLAQRVFASFQTSGSPVTHSIDVAKAVYFAVTDVTAPIRILAGEDSILEEADRIKEGR